MTARQRAASKITIMDKRYVRCWIILLKAAEVIEDWARPLFCFKGPTGRHPIPRHPQPPG